jgi:hypothetical protein
MDSILKEYLDDKRVNIDDLLKRLDNALDDHVMLMIAHEIKARRSAAVEIFRDIYGILYDNNKRSRLSQTDDEKKT